MALNTSRARLNGLTKELMRTWRDTREVWRDAKSDEFQQSYVDELSSGVNSASKAIEDLEKVLNQLRKDCE